MPTLPSPFPQPCDKPETLKLNQKSRAPAIIGLVLCLSCTLIAYNAKNVSGCKVFRQISHHNSVNGKNRRFHARRFSLQKAPNKPIWNDALLNSAKKRKQHRRRGLFLREPHGFWGLGFELSGCWSRKSRKGLHRASELATMERIFRLQFHIEDKEENCRSFQWEHRFAQHFWRKSNAIHWAYSMEKGNPLVKSIPLYRELSIEQLEQMNPTKGDEPMPTMVEETQNSSAYNKTEPGPLGPKLKTAIEKPPLIWFLTLLIQIQKFDLLQ